MIILKDLCALLGGTILAIIISTAFIGLCSVGCTAIDGVWQWWRDRKGVK
jgi:hypothetical protein